MQVQKDCISLCFAKADAILASASWSEHSIRTWDVVTGALLQVIPIESGGKLVGSPDHPFVVVTTRRDETTVCDAELGRCFTLPAPAQAAAFRPDGFSVVTGCGGEEGLRTWYLDSLLEGRALELDDQEAPSAGGLEGANIVGTQLHGPQVDPGLPLLSKRCIC